MLKEIVTSQQVIDLGKGGRPKEDEADIVIGVQRHASQPLPLQRRRICSTPHSSLPPLHGLMTAETDSCQVAFPSIQLSFQIPPCRYQEMAGIAVSCREGWYASQGAAHPHVCQALCCVVVIGSSTGSTYMGDLGRTGIWQALSCHSEG